MGIDVWCVIFQMDDGEHDVYAFNNETAAEWCQKALEKKGYHTIMRKSALFDQVLVNNKWCGDLNNIYCASQLVVDNMRNRRAERIM